MPEVYRPQQSGLSTRVLIFVFASTFVSALLVSGMAIRTLYLELGEKSQIELTAAAEAGAEGILALLGDAGDRASDTGTTPLADAARRTAIARTLTQLRGPSVAHLVLVDAGGRVRVGSSRDAARAPLAIPEPGRRVASEALSFRDARGTWMVAASRPVADTGLRVVAQTPFEEIHAPVMASSSKLFVVDLLLVLVVSFLAYRITSAAVRPIEDLSDAARRIAQGQFDHEIPEPGSQDEIGLLARTFNDMMRRLRGYQSEIEAANQSLRERNNELKQAKETFEQLSITDGLTKLHNHRFFQDHLTREIKRVSRSGDPLSMLLVDIDDFKGLNDRFGHAAGDELLSNLARIMNDTVRESDLLARYGGEEFVVLASDTLMPGAYKLAEKIRTVVAEHSFILDDSLRPTRVTVSIGVALYRGNRKAFFQAADRALYRAKAEGKNCVVLEDEQREL